MPSRCPLTSTLRLWHAQISSQFEINKIQLNLFKEMFKDKWFYLLLPFKHPSTFIYIYFPLGAIHFLFLSFLSPLFLPLFVYIISF